MVSVCPGGQVLLTCERNGSVFHWTVSSPPLDTPREIIVTSQGILLSPEFRIGFTEFVINVTLKSDSPLISQLLISNVTTEINGSAIYCSEDGNENNAPLTVINIKYKGKTYPSIIIILDDNYYGCFIISIDEFLRSMDRSLNVTMVNQLLSNDDVTVTLQWPREPGAVYNVSVSPKVSLTELASMRHYIFAINLTISYNIQYNVSIVSSLCGVTTNRVLKYGK